MLTLQTGRHIIGAVEKKEKGRKVAEDVQYVTQMPSILSKTCKHSDVSTLESIQEALDVTCAHLAQFAYKSYKKLLSQGLSTEDAHLQCSAEKLAVAKVHCMNLFFGIFRESIKDANPSLVPTLTKLCQVYGLSMIKEEAGYFMLFGYYRPPQMAQVIVKVTAIFDVFFDSLAEPTDLFTET